MFEGKRKTAQVSWEESTIESAEEGETLACGDLLAKRLSGGEMILLSGPLGAGKSVLARGIAQGLGVSRWQGSPTFSLVHEYDSVPQLFHVDLYRLSREDTEELGLEEYARSDAVMVIEWPERALDYLRELGHGTIVSVELAYIGEDRRRIEITLERIAGAESTRERSRLL